VDVNNYVDTYYKDMTALSRVRVRFAPAPTGFLHIGGLRTALFNWLFARHNDGAFLVRIEDTDYERSKPAYMAAIIESLEWVGIEADEPIIIQSSRITEHQERAEWLIMQGKAYRCICTPEQMVARCGQTINDLALVRYDGYCRNRNNPESMRHVIRLRVPDTQTHFTFQDSVRGTVTIPRDQLDDFIIVRSDGFPMYNFVVVVDDAYSRITHIIRGEDHIINTPKQILLYEAFEYTVPVFAHIPLVLGPSGQKLSKREAATAVPEYRDAGYLPEALLNYLVRLGWAYGDQEIFTRDELISYFSLEGISKAGSIFDPEKLRWVNSIYLRHYSNEQLITLLEPYGIVNSSQTMSLIALYKDRIATLRELSDAIALVVHGPITYAEDGFTAVARQGTQTLNGIITTLGTVQQWDHDTIQTTLKQFSQETTIPLKVIAQQVRIALTGVGSGPGIFTLLTAVSKDTAVQRLRKLLERL
jgi:glutamyl-tRNA synthetase